MGVVSPRGPRRRAAPDEPGQARTRPRRLRLQPTPPAARFTFFLAAASLFCLLSSAISAPGPATSTRQAARREAAGPDEGSSRSRASSATALTAHARGLAGGGAARPLGQWEGGRRGGSAPLPPRQVGLARDASALLRAGAAGGACAPLLSACNGRPAVVSLLFLFFLIFFDVRASVLAFF